MAIGRLAALISLFLIAYAGLLFDLYDIQINHGTEYRAKAERSYSAGEKQYPDRGIIYFTDKSGGELAAVINKNFQKIYASPKKIQEKNQDYSELAHQLASVLQTSPEDLLAELKGSGTEDDYQLLVRRADESMIQQFFDLGIKDGVYVGDDPARFYNFGNLAAHVLGFVAPNSNDSGKSGKYGVEEYYNDKLIGTPGEMSEKGKFVAPVPGEDLVLSIDPNIQAEGERILNNLVEKYSAKGGSVIVEEPRTGKILTVASTPAFDPNNYSKSEISTFLNPVTQQIYEPGSVFKVVTMSSALDAGKVTPDTRYNDTGKLVIYDKTIQNWDLKAHGWVTMTNVIEKSLNTGSAFAEKKLGHAAFLSYLKKFGFDEKTGIDLPGELRGNLKSIVPKSPEVAYATASYGQGIAVTPIEMINAVSAIANGGKLMKPYLNAKSEPQFIRQAIGKTAADQVTQMMVSAVDKAEVAHIKGYSIAGKTGTALVPENGRYTDRVINTYIGFGPTSDPKFVILIKLNEPQGSPLAGQTVVPAFRDLAQFILNYYNIPPDRVE